MSDPLPFGGDIVERIKQAFFRGLSIRNREGRLLPFMQTPEGLFGLALDNTEMARQASASWLAQADSQQAYTIVTWDGEVTIGGTTTSAIVTEYRDKAGVIHETFVWRYRAKPSTGDVALPVGIELIGAIVRLAI